MTKIGCIGSLNIDMVYGVDHLVKSGETLSTLSRGIFPGGKGLNQAVALSKAGGTVEFLGKIGPDGDYLLEFIKNNGVAADHIVKSDLSTGHAIIQVDSKGSNSILLHSGANYKIEASEVAAFLGHMEAEEYIIFQNEVNNVNDWIQMATNKSLRVIFNPSPMGENILKVPFETIDWLIINEVEGRYLTDCEKPEDILDTLCKRYASLKIILTNGSKGSYYATGSYRYFQGACSVETLDTTGAGDTFLGYFVANLAKDLSVEKSMTLASAAAALAVTKEGAGASIPWAYKVNDFINKER